MEYWDDKHKLSHYSIVWFHYSITPVLQYSIVVAMSQDIRKKKLNPFLDTSFLIFAALAMIAGGVCYSRGKDVFYLGLNSALSLFVDIAPRLCGAFLMAGFVEVLVPKDLVTKWMGERSGIKGILIATVAGVVTPGGPMISFPLIAALYKLGADLGPLVGYLTSWELMGIQRIIVWEIPFMGIRFATLRFAVSLLLPIIAALTAQRLASHFRVVSR